MDWFNNWIDKHFEKQGYKLVRCDKYHILQKNSGNHIVQCYDENVITASIDNKTVFVNSVDGIYTSLLFWIWLKYEWLSHKYDWKRMQNHYD